MPIYCPYCTVDTTGKHEANCPNNTLGGFGPAERIPEYPLLSGAPVGWICPLCGRANSPFTATCPCHSFDPKSIINATGTANTDTVPLVEGGGI